MPRGGGGVYTNDGTRGCGCVCVCAKRGVCGEVGAGDWDEGGCTDGARMGHG